MGPGAPRTKGSALIAVLVLIAIGTIAVIALVRSTDSFQKLGMFFRKKATLLLAAESGLALAHGDLSERTESGFSDVLGPDGETLDPVAVGLVYAASGRTVEPRFVKRDLDDIAVRVYYFPADPGPGVDPDQWDIIWPKYYHVISEATQTSTGEVHTVEAMVQLRAESMAEISFGMLNPALLPGMGGCCPFSFSPATYEGHVHFGHFPGDYAVNLNGWGPGRPHTFKGPVTFADKPKVKRPYPFTYSKDSDGNSLAEIDFRQGWVDDHAISPDSGVIFSELTGTAPPAPVIDLRTKASAPTTNDFCLKFQTNSTTGRGEIWRYDCDVRKYSAFQRYAGEADKTGGEKLLDETQYSGRVLVCDDAVTGCTIHIKGVLKGALTIAATDVSLEGDIVYSDQNRATSRDRLGVLARHDLIVPMGVPYGVSWGDPNEPMGYTSTWAMDNYASDKSKFTGITNFIIPNDRDVGDTEYHVPWANPTALKNGVANDVGTLDLDGSYVALGERKSDGSYIGGLLRMEGLNDFDVSPANGATIAARDAEGNYTLYSADVDGPNSFFLTDPSDKLVKRRAEPAFCRWKSDGTCPTLQEQEAAGIWSPAEQWRTHSIALWVFGGLVTNGYSYLWRTDYYGGKGFQRRIYHEDKRLRTEPPPGFPATGQIVQDVLWIKNYRHRSEKLADYLAGR